MEWNNNKRIETPMEGGGGQAIRLFVTIRKDSESNVEYKKMTVMAPLSIKISMLKRHIEREFADLFPHEPTFVCAKLEDEFGYSLSNASMVSELLKNSDRLSAIPESFTKDLIGKMHVTHDLNELTFMLKSITQTIIAKLAEAELGPPETQMDIMQLIIPVGFSLQQKAINHNTALTLKRIFENERLQFLDDQSYALISQLLVKLLQFWTNDLIFQDQFLLNLTVDLLEILTKSAAFSTSYKTPQIVNSLMSVSKLDFVSAQTRSRIIKLISFLSRPQFTNCYQPRSYDGPLQLNLPPQPRRRNEEYVPSILEQPNRNSNRRQGSAGIRNQNGFEQQQQDFNQYPYKQNDSNQYPYRQNDSNQYGFKQNESNQYQQSNMPKLPPTPQQFGYQSQPLQSNYPPPQQNPVYSKPQLNINNRPQSNRNPNQYGGTMQQQVFDGLVQDYLNLISTESNEEMLQFAIQNLSDGIDTTIHQIMDNPEAFQKIVNLLEIAMSPNYLGMQLRVLEALSKNMNQERAKEGLKLKLIPRIMKAFTYQPKEFQAILYDMLSATLKLSDFQVDVLTVITMIESAYPRIQMLGIKILSLMSDPQRLQNTNNVSIQFENYIKSLMDWTLDGQKGEEFQYNALQTLSNLAINDYIRPQILHLKGIEFFLKVLRESYRVDAQRLAAKGLLNLSIKSRETKLSIVSLMEEEIQRLQRGEMDTVVQGYLTTLLTTRERGQLL
ncbi:unnamed protein product (macronuclear) [Paramecium tetraurelia]|uniref:TOG domain-containing protein n=1 Tax=Paramecium tetraurelia TaxID=5888 RepID=A0CUC9_PARTE|nr:uncharacterized protein GSPATT00010596001 [Paramecium tetraurelia]CAK74396.1 unnamed protein product [Paramecium tetraurelia]|eukprot:XP_001441793.1 hypothetical protein (macronuclear) [Paramecium tetraurelia strain d4-2]